MPIDTTLSSRLDTSTTREKREARDALEAKLMEGIHSIEHELAPADWCDIRAEALAAVDARKKPVDSEGVSDPGGCSQASR